MLGKYTALLKDDFKDLENDDLYFDKLIHEIIELFHKETNPELHAALIEIKNNIIMAANAKKRELDKVRPLDAMPKYMTGACLSEREKKNLTFDEQEDDPEPGQDQNNAKILPEGRL